MYYIDESGILTMPGEPPKILSVHDDKHELYRIHYNPIKRGTWFMSSYTLPFHQVDLRTSNLEEAKIRAKRRYEEFLSAA